MIVTPVANIPSVRRSATGGSSPSTSSALDAGTRSNGISPIASGPPQTAVPVRGTWNSLGGCVAIEWTNSYSGSPAAATARSRSR
jgi:hypothetical protein